MAPATSAASPSRPNAVRSDKPSTQPGNRSGFAQHRGAGNTGSDGVHPDAVTAPLHSGDLDQHVTPALDTQYAPMSRSATVPLMLETATIEPPHLRVDHGLRGGPEWSARCR